MKKGKIEIANLAPAASYMLKKWVKQKLEIFQQTLQISDRILT